MPHEMSASRLAQNNGQPVLVLLKQHNSHPFDNRTIIVSEEIKVGRAVARLRSSKNNAIFDCKVLSRSHAIIWYSDDKFWLKDTNSSNGTFVNNNKLVEADNEMADREIYSGDFIKFGVEVVEHDTTHGCIIAQVKLYHPDGSEAVPPAPHVTHTPAYDQSLFCNKEQVFQLTSHINEALYREVNIEKKLENLKYLLSETKEVSQTSWKAMLNEDRLLEKLEHYERELKMFKENVPDDCLKSQVSLLLEEKRILEEESKCKVDKILQDKQAALKSSLILEKNLEDSERELSRLKSNVEDSEKAFERVSTDYMNKVKELQSLEAVLEAANTDKTDLSSKLYAAMSEIRSLEQKIENDDKVVSSNVHNDVTTEDRKLQGLVDKNDKLRSSISKKAESVCDEVALAELEGLDKFMDMQDSNEKNLEQAIDRLNKNVGENLVQGAKQFTHSLKLIKLLQEQLIEMDRTKAIYERSVLNSKDSRLPDLKPLHDSISLKIEDEEQHVSSTDDNVKAADFSISIQKANELAQKLETTHVIAESHFLEYFHEQENVRENITAKDYLLDSNHLPLKEYLTSVELCEPSVVMSESQAAALQPLPSPSMEISSISSTYANDDASTNEDYSVEARDKVNARQANGGQHLKERDIMNKVNDGKKCELIVEDGDSTAKSLRIENEVLRKKVNMIEDELVQCKKIYDRLKDESQKSNDEVASLKHTNQDLIKRIETIASNPVSDNLRECRSDSLNDIGGQRNISTASAYIVIPLMVLLLALMMSIFNYF